MHNRVASPTHDHGRTLDIVASRDDLPAPSIDVSDTGLSDHRLLRWSAPLVRPRPVYISTIRRSWKEFDIVEFSANLQSSLLCRPETWPELNIEGLVQLYDDEITALIDHQIPERSVTCRRRPSDSWFDEECRKVKRHLRHLERVSQQTISTDLSGFAAALAAWTAQRRIYRDLLKTKRELFWQSKVQFECSTPRQLWRSVDVLMGRGTMPPSDVISAATSHKFFDDKVAGVRSSTSDALPPSFTAAPPGCQFAEFQPVTIADV